MSGHRIAAGFVTQHAAHLLLFLVPSVTMLGLAAVAELRAWRRTHPRRDSTRQRPPATILAAAGLSFGAAGVHAWVCPEHFHELVIYGVFFMCAAAAQLGWAALLLVRPSRLLLLVGLVGNLAVVVLWAATRSIGLPWGPEAGAVEAVGWLDVIATTCELGVIVSTALALRASSKLRTAPAA